MSTYFKYFRSWRRSWCPPAKGFTLIEMLLVTAIIVIITVALLVQQGKFNSSSLMRSLTYSVALSVRQAQIYGSSVRGFVSGGTTTFVPGYGTYFQSSDLTHYYVFADINGDGVRAAGTEDLPVYTIGRGAGADYKIKKFCATLIIGGAQVCSDTGTISSLTIYFRRPNSDGCFASSASPAACAVGATPVYSSAYIQLVSMGGGETRSITVTNNGQISVGSAGT